MNDFKRLYPFIRPHRTGIAISLLLFSLVGIFQSTRTTLSLPLFDNVLLVGKGSVAATAKEGLIQKYVSFILSLMPGRLTMKVCLALLILTALKGICDYYSNYSMSHIGQKVVTDLRDKLFHHVLGQSMSFFSTNSTGRLMSRMSGDVEQIQDAVSNVLAELFREVVTLLSLLVTVLLADWKLALLSLLIAPLALSLTLGMGKRIRHVSRKGREDAANLNDHLQQAITGMRIIKAFGMERHEEDGFRTTAARLLRSNLKAAAILFINSPVMELLGVVAFIPLLYYAHARINHHTLTAGMYGLVMFALFSMYDPIRKLSRIHVQVQRAFASSTRIVELLDTHREIQDKPGARTLDGFRDSVEFENVFFDYADQSGETHVLKNINLKASRNQVIAIVGSSGSGKTTLVGLIPRFYDTTSGVVRIDGTDVREYTQGSLRSQIAIVTQETFLFNDTVRNNIAYGNIRASEEQIMEASRAALADDFISKFPMKYETIIGERGQRLSGGERQRISIARAILKDAPILILDEATSALDSESEKLVQQALTNLIRNRTTFVIAHRLSTIRNADMILVLDRGRIVESGTHDALILNDGPYRKFFRLQTEESPEFE
ncbi:MAG TPA: ABC transporter ATP-binding protein [Acidobacteriota bacterium]|nr:ABC transporter ATP-binding protein [Acidobacteriota bacterium]